MRHNVAPHKRPGYAIVTLSTKVTGVPPGDVTDVQMDAVADWADRFGFGEIRISHEQNFVLPDVPRARPVRTVASWRAQRLATANLGKLTDIICCPGGDYCSLANAKSIPIAEAIQQRFDDLDYLYDLGDIDLNISGCMNACGHHHVGHIGILGVDKKGEEWYQISIGGSAGRRLLARRDHRPVVFARRGARRHRADSRGVCRKTGRRRTFPRLLSSHRNRAFQGAHLCQRSLKTAVVVTTTGVLREEIAERYRCTAYDRSRQPTRWRTRTRCSAEARVIGIWLPGDGEPDEIESLLPKAPLIAIRFAAMNDGRGLSLAVLLRTRFGYTGELRAIGEVHEDVLHYLRRCGFDSYQLPDGHDPAIALAAMRIRSPISIKGR